MINIYTGPMFSGKSTRLVQEYNKFYNKDNILILKPVKDTREFSKIRARGIDIDITARTIKDLSEIPDLVKNTNYRVIFIDEAQFITGDTSIINNLSINGFDFYIAGLNQTSEQKPFGIIPNLMAMADNIELIKAKCTICNRDASYTYCNAEKDGDILVGSGEYIAICHKCLKEKLDENK